MDKIAILIPCYNESQTIKKVVSDFKRELPEAVIYVYDNNSTDGQIKLQLLDMSINKVKVMLSEECFRRLMQNVI